MDKLTLRVYSKRWGHHDLYRLALTEKGWNISHMAHSGPCDQTGEPYLYSNFRQDEIAFPPDLPSWMAQLWQEATKQHLPPAAIQKRLDEIGAMICSEEMASRKK